MLNMHKDDQSSDHLYPHHHKGDVSTAKIVMHIIIIFHLLKSQQNQLDNQINI